MNAHAIPRLFVIVLTCVLLAAGFALAPAAAAEGVNWSDTQSGEDVLVQDCRGASVVGGFSPTLAFGFDFAITTSYRLDRAFTMFADYTGIEHPVMERRFVTFAGTAANTTTGLELAYDGHFTRTATAAQEDVTITDLTLHLVTSNEEDFIVTVDRDRPGVIDTPEAMLLAYAPRGLHVSLCSYFAGLHGAAE
ncbi:MAG: hypothetical protein ACJ789_04205 [Thermomicrobiales bacterium]